MNKDRDKLVKALEEAHRKPRNTTRKKSRNVLCTLRKKLKNIQHFPFFFLYIQLI